MGNGLLAPPTALEGTHGLCPGRLPEHLRRAKPLVRGWTGVWRTTEHLRTHAYLQNATENYTSESNPTRKVQARGG